MDECIFCRIVAGQVPAATLIETDKVMSFMDVAPVNPGHSLVVPKRHVESLADLTQEELHVCIFAVQRVARVVLQATGAPGFNVLQNNHRCSGQVVPHVHFHIIPRRPDDGFKFAWRQGRYAKGEMQELQRKILGLL